MRLCQEIALLLGSSVPAYKIIEITDTYLKFLGVSGGRQEANTVSLAEATVYKYFQSMHV